jgi:hypothetical protein
MPAGKPRSAKLRPIICIWDGQHMIPLPRFERLCASQFVVNEEYPLMLVENRSLASHNHYFASLTEAFDNLAEEYAQEFDSVEHLRAWCLCMEGFCTQTRYELNTAADARVLRDVLKVQDKATIVKINGSVAIVYTPESQAMYGPNRMHKDRFQASKDAVLARAASMARTTPAELKQNAGRSA